MISSAFEPVDIKRQGEYASFWDRCPLKASDYGFANLWGWAKGYGLLWAWTESLVWIKQTIPESRYWAPIGPWDTIDWQSVLGHRADSYANRTFIRIPERLLTSWKGTLDQAFAVTDTQGDWDYLYSVPELIELKGNRFHKKKNLINQFKKRYAYRYQPFDSTLVDAALAMQNDWCTWRDCESSDLLTAENRAISRTLQDWNRLDRLFGGALFVEDKMVAHTIAEHVDAATLVIHFEKGDPDYKGVYQAINQLFLKHSAPSYHWVNREQDLDNPGLRKAKLSYHPVDYIKKYRVDFP